MHEVETNDGRHFIDLKVTANSIAHHVTQLTHRLSLSEDRMSERLCAIPAFGRFLDREYDL